MHNKSPIDVHNGQHDDILLYGVSKVIGWTFSPEAGGIGANPLKYQGEQRHHENLRNPSREAKHQRDLLKDYFNHLEAQAG